MLLSASRIAIAEIEYVASKLQMHLFGVPYIFSVDYTQNC